MEKTKVLYICQEVYPYVGVSQEAMLGRYLAQGIFESGMEIRMFTPRYGCINERKNQLHEVLRLSGLIIPINETDHPLVIKVSSVPSVRMQIYFIDNEEYFQKKNMLVDKNGQAYSDTDERLIFFARGAIEAIKKLSWKPDIIHCNGWFTSLVPLYIKKIYKDDIAFNKVPVISTLFPGTGFEGELDPEFMHKLKLDKLNLKNIAGKTTGIDYNDLSKLAIDYSDAVVYADKSAAISAELNKYCKAKTKSILQYTTEEKFVENCKAFYEKLLSQEK